MKKGSFKRKGYLSHFKKSLLIIHLARIFIFFGIVAFSTNGYSQIQSDEREISGRVTDAKNEPIPGVTVNVIGTTSGVITNIDGYYNLSVSFEAKALRFSSIGFDTKEVVIGNQSQINLTLEESMIGLDEVVVVGYGTQTKASVVGAISQVSGDDLVRSGITNVTNAIAGKLSGVLTIQSTGEPGASDSEIVIRGLSSWSGSQPLVLVDGVERDYKSLDPNEIQTLSVLKDASATAVFGAKGANGVILVTTKRGRIGKPKFDASMSYGIQVATELPKHIDSYTTMNMLNVAYKNRQNYEGLIPQHVLDEYKNPSSRINELRYPNVNWFDLLTEPYAPTYNGNINISGGTEFVQYFASLGYLEEGSFFKGYKDGHYDLNYNYKRLNYRANVDFNLSGSTVLSFNMGGETGKKNQPQDSPWPIWRDMYTTTGALFPAYFPDWALDYIPDPDYPDDKGERLATAYDTFTQNPYSRMQQGAFNENTSSKLFTDLILDQKLDFILKGLSVKGKVALSTYYDNNTLTGSRSLRTYQMNWSDLGEIDPETGKVIAPKIDPISGEIINPWGGFNRTEIYSPPVMSLGVGGLRNNFYQDYYYEAALNYNRSFGNHNVTGLALFNRHKKNEKTDFPYLNQGFVSRATYNYRLKYMLDINLGYTGSERFAPGNRYGLFPSGAIGWVLSEEEFFNVSWISKLKFRYSEGLVGSDKAANRWLYVSDFYKDHAGYIHESLGANTVAQWEEARKRDIAVEVGLFNDQLSFELDFFDEYRSKMLLQPNTTTMFVGNNFKELNMGEVKKQGFEVESKFNKTLSPNFRFFLGAMLSFSENRIMFKDDLPYAPEHQKAAGKPLGNDVTNGVLLTGTGYLTSIDDIHNSPIPTKVENLNVGDYRYLDYNADGNISVLDKYPIEGLAYPPIVYSFSGGFAYRNFDFNFLFQGNKGKYVNFNQMFEQEFVKDAFTVHAAQLDYWTPTNPGANHQTLHYSDATNLTWGGGNDNSGYEVLIKDRFWRKADYLRLKEVYLAYSLSENVLRNLTGISSVQVYFNASNLITFTDLIEGDPERKDFQRGYYPLMASFKLGARVSF